MAEAGPSTSNAGNTKSEWGKRMEQRYSPEIWACIFASYWSREKLEELLNGLKIETDLGICEMMVSKKEGHAFVNNYDNTVFYKWDLQLKWKGALVNSDTEVTGTVQVSNLCDENEIDDVDVIILLDSTGPESEILKSIMASCGVNKIKTKLSEYVYYLKLDFSKGLMIPITKPKVIKTAHKDTSVTLKTVIQVFMQSHPHELQKKKSIEQIQKDTAEWEKRKKIVNHQIHLLKLIHVSLCHIPKKSIELKLCNRQGCQEMQCIVKHIENCQAKFPGQCNINLCFDTKQLICHWKKCGFQHCQVCWPIQKAYYRNQIYVPRLLVHMCE